MSASRGSAYTRPNATWLSPRANPTRNIWSTSWPVIPWGSPSRQSHPRLRPSFSPPGTSTPELPMDPGPDCVRSIMSLPNMEKVDAESDDTDFFSNARAAFGGANASAVPRVYWLTVDRKHSSHCSNTREVTVSRSSIADKIVNCWEADRMTLGSARQVSTSSNRRQNPRLI